MRADVFCITSAVRILKIFDKFLRKSNVNDDRYNIENLREQNHGGHGVFGARIFYNSP
jgi:hypothetical protein